MTRLILILLLSLSINVIQAQFFFEGFEDWTDTLAARIPDNWVLQPIQDSAMINIERVNAINDESYALNLKSNIAHWEGNFTTTLGYVLPFYTDNVNIRFTYKCEGQGWCKIALGEGSWGHTGIFKREIWSVYAGDTSVYTIQLDSVALNQPFDLFRNIFIEAGPIPGPIVSAGVSSFTIDSLVIESNNTLVNTHNLRQPATVTIYPNPTSGAIFIKALPIQNPEKTNFYLFDVNGRLIRSFTATQPINIKDEPAGIYFLRIVTGDTSIVKRVIKVED